MTQMSLLDLMQPAAIRRPVDPDGPVCGEVDEVLRLPHPRLAWDLARIELARHSDGLWMWGIVHCCGGYRVGPKWGRFAASRDAALHHARAELLEWHGKSGHEGRSVTAAQWASIRTWAEGLL